MKNDRLIQQNAQNIAVMNEKMKNIEGDVSEIKQGIRDLIQKIDDNYLTKEEFRPYKVSFGIIGTAFVLYVVNLFLRMIDIKL